MGRREGGGRPGGGRGAAAGFALVAALGFGLALAALAAGLTRDSRGAVAAAAGAVGAAEARAAAEAGLWRAAAALSASAARRAGPPPPPLDGAPQPWSFEGVTVRVTARAEDARVDLNRADARELAAAAQAAGLAEPEAFAAAVLARRRALAAAGIPWSLDAVAFPTVETARGLAPAALWPALAERLTAHGRRTPATVEAAEPDPVPAPGRAYALRAEAETPAGARAAVAAVVTLEGPNGFRVVEWRGAVPLGPPAPRAAP
ncbi:hypothetical protein [Rubrimonas cliftonensis]|uniref:General secretion pathway protein GspK n=1 Tax=Rubrimonas cliftonensis TaxID=89524 RepID=A0A1H3WQX4_9RHOB|nr:hypothetical protein [Rubrimonas cliftonensis]SDZ89350.1 hypothetical protein SAMN05444370_10274 [Rubrimonas cliftonensis]